LGGGEIILEELEYFSKKHGIRSLYLVERKPHQNGVVERENKTFRRWLEKLSMKGRLHTPLG